jgi:hypothetical protein
MRAFFVNHLRSQPLHHNFEGRFASEKIFLAQTTAICFEDVFDNDDNDYYETMLETMNSKIPKDGGEERRGRRLE